MDNKILKSFNVIKEMFNDRKYNIIKENNTDIIYILGNNDKNEKILAYYISEKTEMTQKKFVSLVNKLYKEFNFNDNDKFIFVLTFLPQDSNDIPDKINEKFSSDKIQLFHIKRLQFNITKHILSPKYIKLTESEIESLKKDYDLNNIAKIPIFDPICKYYDMKTNDIFKIIRKSNNAYQYNTYRIVI